MGVPGKCSLPVGYQHPAYLLQGGGYQAGIPQWMQAQHAAASSFHPSQMDAGNMELDEEEEDDDYSDSTLGINDYGKCHWWVW